MASFAKARANYRTPAEAIHRPCSSTVLESGKTRVTRLESGGPLIGMVPEMQFDAQTTTLGPGATLLLFSDGVFEIQQTNGKMWKFDDFVGFVGNLPPNEPVMDRLLSHVQGLGGSSQLEDDFSIAEAVFCESALRSKRNGRSVVTSSRDVSRDACETSICRSP